MTPPLKKQRYKVIRTQLCEYAPCRQPFFVTTHRPNRRFCSQYCAAHAPKVRRPLDVCEAAGCTNAVRGRHRYCCAGCFRLARAKPRIMPCSMCKKPFDNGGNYDKKYCSGKCRSEARTRGRKKYLCLVCNEDTGGHRKNAKLYCSKKCKHIGRATKKIDRPNQIRAHRVTKKRPPTPDDLALYASAMKIGTKAAGAECGLSKSAVNGRLWRCGLSSKSAPRAASKGRKIKPSLGFESVCTREELKNRGWSERIIGSLLGAPDRVDRNWRDPRRPIKLWMASRVYEAEKHPDFLAYQPTRAAKSKRRRDAHIIKKALTAIREHRA